MGIREHLRNQNIPFVTLLHAPAPSAARFAQSVHVSGTCVAKCVLVRGSTSYILAVVPATHRVELERLEKVMGQAGLAIASEDEVESVFRDCERGAMPPFGSLYGIATVVDARLASQREIVLEANTRHEGLRVRFRDYESVEHPIRARIACPIQPRRPREAHHAG